MQVPKPRKQPKQERSRLLVESVKQACREVLNTEGANALTTLHLAEVTGISVGSLYQYFPNIESVVAAVYEDLLREYLEERKDAALQKYSDITTIDALRSMIEGSVGFHSRLLRLNFKFHCRYHRCFDLDKAYDEIAGTQQFSLTSLTNALLKENSDISKEEAQRCALLATLCFKAMIMEIMDEQPELLFEERISDELLAMSSAVIPNRVNRG
ncbi:TetR/AcrR family transcriptional regulator [Spongiibacter sp. KMU-166]|uniref:TetR/AcrR family transcriptional regulator n=1 Tax=Spongiibacter thalassae TaxID=2721624 RepID=A0ABX1GBK7_9GAMM|nr:TetR/AcrR family transcriptional regulator [Spongiibacter thalassae]NKI16551.1 TetR/AcrR family transcriptional regulator [Spongiibacter thalassae]